MAAAIGIFICFSFIFAFSIIHGCKIITIYYLQVDNNSNKQKTSMAAAPPPPNPRTVPVFWTPPAGWQPVNHGNPPPITPAGVNVQPLPVVDVIRCGKSQHDALWLEYEGILANQNPAQQQADLQAFNQRATAGLYC